MQLKRFHQWYLFTPDGISYAWGKYLVEIMIKYRPPLDYKQLLLMNHDTGLCMPVTQPTGFSHCEGIVYGPSYPLLYRNRARDRFWMKSPIDSIDGTKHAIPKDYMRITDPARIQRLDERFNSVSKAFYHFIPPEERQPVFQPYQERPIFGHQKALPFAVLR